MIFDELSKAAYLLSLCIPEGELDLTYSTPRLQQEVEIQEGPMKLGFLSQICLDTLPIGVRAADTITTSVLSEDIFIFVIFWNKV